LGNHDYYGSSFDFVNQQVLDVTKKCRNLIWVDKQNCFQICNNFAVVGSGSWADCREGDWDNSNVVLNDYSQIVDFKHISKSDIRKKMQEIVSISQKHIEESLSLSFMTNEHVFLLTHVPPFLEASTYNGKVSDSNWAPHFVCKAMGKTVEKFMGNCRGDLLVLCGHTHGYSELNRRKNLKVITGDAEYGKPKVNKVFQI